MDDIEANNVGNKKLRFPTKNRFLTIASIIIILFSIIAFGFGVYATMQVTEKTKTFEDLNASWCSSVPIVERPTQKSSYVHISYVGASKEMKIVENYERSRMF